MTGKLPYFNVYTVTGAKPAEEDFPDDDKSGYWTKIGGAWLHGDKGGFNIELQALPLDGKLILRKPKVKDTKPE